MKVGCGSFHFDSPNALDPWKSELPSNGKISVGVLDSQRTESRSMSEESAESTEVSAQIYSSQSVSP